MAEQSFSAIGELWSTSRKVLGWFQPALGRGCREGSRWRSSKAFTLAELLMALLILGQIATFTIPKVLQAQQGSRYNAVGKEVVAMISGAYSAYRLTTTPTANTRARDLTPYMNYVRVDSATTVDHVPGNTTIDCSTSTYICLRLHAGGVLALRDTNRFGGTDSLHYLYFFYDPDAKACGTTNCPGKSIVVDLHFNGRVKTSNARVSGEVTYLSGSVQNFSLDPLPEWFSWN